MKRLAFVLITGILLVGLSGSCWAEAGFWIGPKGLYFRPSYEPYRKLYRTYWGWGGEAGWVSRRHLEFSLEARYIGARQKLVMQAVDPRGNIVGDYWYGLYDFAFTPRLYLRLMGSRTPYLGFGISYHRVTLKMEGVEIWWVDEEYKRQSSSAFGPALLVGYDYRLAKWAGLRSEGSYQNVKVSYRIGALAYERDLSGWTASLGTYIAW